MTIDELEKNIAISQLKIKIKALEIEVELAYLRGLKEACDIGPYFFLKRESIIKRMYLLIEEKGHPMHIDDIMKELNFSGHSKKLTLVSSLHMYKKKGLFVQVGPNVFDTIKLKSFLPDK